MASFFHQIKVLLWKNWLSAVRQPVWSLVLILWPLVIFIILAITRPQFPPQKMANCYLAPRSLQSAGLIPFLENFLCNTDTKCSKNSYTPQTYNPVAMNSISTSTEFNLNISAQLPGASNIQSCINFIFTIVMQVENGSFTTVLPGLIQALANQDLNNELKACISLNQWIPCEVGTSQWSEVKQAYEISYWLVTSLTNATNNNVCTFNGTNVICDSSIQLGYLFERALILINEVNGDPANLLRIMQRAWVIFKQNKFDELVIEKLNQKITIQYSQDPQAQIVLTELFRLLLNTTDLLITESSLNLQFLNTSLVVVQKLLGQFNLLLPRNVQGEPMNSTQILMLLLQSLAQNIQYHNLTGLLSTYNVSSQALTELHLLIQTMLPTLTDSASLSDATALIKIFSILNQPQFSDIKQTLQTLLNLDPTILNVTSVLTDTFSLFNQVTHLSSILNSSANHEVYFKQILNYLMSDATMINNLWSLNSYISYGEKLDFLQSDAFKTFILDFFSPGNLQNLGSNATNITTAFFKLLTTIIPPQGQEIFQHFQNASVALLDSVNTCQKEQNKCTDSVLVFQQLLVKSIVFVASQNNSIVQPELATNLLLQFQDFSTGEISVINNIFSMAVCFQGYAGFSCNSSQGIYKQVLDAINMILNVTITYDQSLMTKNQLTATFTNTFTNTLQVLQSAEFYKLHIQLENIANASRCYYTQDHPLQCTLQLSSSLTDLLQALPSTQTQNDTLFAVSFFAKAWQKELEGAVDVYLHLSYLYNLTQLAFQNDSALQDIHTSITSIIQSLEEIQSNWNSTMQGSGKSIGSILEILKAANVDDTIPATLLSQTFKELENIRTKLQIVQWYVFYVKNETENISNSGNIYPFVAMTQLILNDVLSTIQGNPSLVSLANEVQNAMNVLDTNHILPSLQSLLNVIMQDSVQNVTQVLNKMASVFQDEFLNGTLWNTFFTAATKNDTMLVLRLLQEYDSGSLVNVSSALNSIERILLELQSVVNDTNLLITLDNDNLQVILSVSKEIMDMISNVEYSGNFSVESVDKVYILLLELLNTSSIQNFTSMEGTLKNILYLSMQCLLNNSNPTTNQNCFAMDIVDAVQSLLNESGCQISLTFPHTKDNMTLNDILESGLISTLSKTLTECDMEAINVKEGLICFTESLGLVFNFLHGTNKLFGLNISWVQQTDTAMALISEELLKNNMTCASINHQAVDLIKQVFGVQENSLNKLISLLSYQSLNGKDLLQYSNYWNETIAILKLYISTQGQSLSNDTMFNILNDAIFNFINILPDATNPWLTASAILETLYNMSTNLGTSQQLQEFLQILNNLNKVHSLADQGFSFATQLSDIFNGNFTEGFLNPIKQWMSALNVTSAETCTSSLQTIYSQSVKPTISDSNTQLFTNISMWTCRLIFSNQSSTGWIGKPIAAIIMSIETTAQTNVTQYAGMALHIISSVRDLVNVTSLENLNNFITSLAETLKEQNTTNSWIVYQAVHNFINSLQSLVNEALINGTNDPSQIVEEVTLQVIGAVNTLLQGLNVTGYEEVFSVASDILQAFFSNRNTSLALDNIAQKTLTQIMTYLQNYGLEKCILQALQNQISTANPDNQDAVRILEEFLNIMLTAINVTTSEIGLQPSYPNANLILNTINVILGQLNNSRLQDILSGNNKNITEYVVTLMNAILQNALQQNNVSSDWTLSQNGTSQTVFNLERLINNWISQSEIDPGFSFNYSATLVKLFYHLYESEDEQQLYHLLNYSSRSINVTVLRDALVNLYDLIHLNDTGNMNIARELYLKQLLNFISDSQLNKELSSLINISQHFSFSPNSEVALELLKLIDAASPFNVVDASNLTSLLFNLFSGYITQQDQGSFNNITSAIVSAIEILQKCSQDVETCVRAVSAFQNLVVDVVHALSSLEMYGVDTLLANSSLLEFNLLDEADITLIDNMFLVLLYSQENSYNVSGIFTNVYQQVLTATDIIANITKELNNSSAQSGLEMIRDDLQSMKTILQILSDNNMTESLLHIIRIHQSFHCPNLTDVGSLQCIFNFTSNFLNLLNQLHLSAPLTAKIATMSSLVDYWMKETNITAKTYQQLVSFYEQANSTLHPVLITLTDLLQTLDDIKTDNDTNSYSMEQDINRIFELLQPYGILNSSNITFNTNIDDLEKVQAQLDIVQWYVMHVRNLTGNLNTSEEIYPMYKLTQLIFSNVISTLEANALFQKLNQVFAVNPMSPVEQLQMWAELSSIINNIMSDLNNSSSPEFTTIWQSVNRILAGDWNKTSTDDFVKTLQAWSASAPSEVLLLKVEHFVLETISPIQDMLNTKNDSLQDAMLSFSLEAVKQFINRTQNTSVDDNFYIPFLKQMWQSFRQSGLEDLIEHEVNELILKSDFRISSDQTIWAQVLRLMFNVTDLIISEMSPSPPYVTTNTTVKILQAVVEDILPSFLPQTENTTEVLEESLQTVLNLTRTFIALSEQNEISQFNTLISSLSSMTLGAGFSNDTAKLLQLFSTVNQTGLIPQIVSTLQVIFTSSNVEQGKLFINVLDMFIKLTQLNNTGNVPELSSVFATYFPSSVETENQTQASLNTILNLLMYLNRLSVQQPAEIANAAIEILPFFLSPELQTYDTINQTAGLLGLITQYMPPAELDNFQQVANTSLMIIDSIHTCSVIPENCTDLIGGFQQFMLDVTRLQAAIQNGSWGGQFANSSLPQFGSYDNLQKTLINDIVLLLSSAQSYPYNSSELLRVVNWILNTTKNELDIPTTTSLQSVIDVLRSANIIEFIQQLQNVLHATACSNQTDADLVLCSLDLTFQITQLLQLLPLTQPMNQTLSVISSVAEQWLNTIHANLSTYQQLTYLYNVTSLTFQYQPILQAINTSVVNIIDMLKGSTTPLEVNLNGTVRILSQILQVSYFDATNYNLFNVLTCNISDVLDNIRLQLDVVQWLLLHTANETSVLETLFTYTISAVAHWVITNYQHISLIIKDTVSVIESLDNSFSLSDFTHIFNVTFQNEHLQVLIKQVETVIYNSSGLTFLENLLMNENIQNDTVLALHLLQDINQVNSSLAFTSINNVIMILQGLTGIELGYLNQFHNNATVAKVFTIVREGMGILYDIQVKESIDKDMIYRIYKFTYLLVQDEWNWVPFKNISAMELFNLIPLQDLQLVNEQLSSLAEMVGLPNVTTSPDIKVTIGNIFGNNITVMNALSQVVKLNQSSIQSLMEVPIPDNMTQILSWIVQLSQCHSNLSLVPGSLQEFCDLSPTQGYQMGIIFLQNVDVTKLLYRLIIPASWETNIDYLLTVLSKLIDQFGLVTLRTKDIYTMISITNLLKSSSTSTRKNYQFMTRSQSTGSASFMDISNYICTKNYTMLGEAFSSLVPMVKMSRQATQRAQSLSSIYGIPSQNTFCSELFLNLVQSSSGAAYWMLLKPLLYGKILYTPNTTDTQKIMDTTNTILQDMKGYRDLMNTTYTSINMLMKLWPLFDQVQSLINVMQNLLNKPFVSAIITNILNTTTTELLGKVNQAAELITLLNGTMNEIDTFGNYAYVLSNLLSCMEYDRMQPKNNVTDMMAEAYTLQKTNELFAAVTFDLPSESNSTKRNTPGTLPKQVKYSISMRSLLSEDTSSIKDLYWTLGPHISGNKYSWGFVYLQENIERAIIKIQTNKTLDDIGAQFQPMPYPCYNKDSWLYSMSFSLPNSLMITWVLFVAAFVKKLVHEKELRLHEYMKMMGINSFSHFSAWLIESTLFLIVTDSILVLILKFGKILPNSNGFILFLFFLDYSLTVISMSYLISVFFHNTNIAALSGSLIYIIAFFPYIVVASKENLLSMAGKTLLCIFSPTALSYGTQYIVYYEEQDTGIQWNNMYKSPVLNDTFNCAWTCWMMLIDSFIYFIVGAYIRTVFPGMYGIGAVWYFPFLPSFWLESCGLAHLCPKKVSGLKSTNMMVQSGSQKKGGDNNFSPNNEMEPSDLNVGISLHGLTKTYNSKMAVKDLNLTFYEGHITAIMGHNGAGKTTTLSMLTGLFSATSGTIYIYGEDIRTHLNSARKSMGVCMQYDVLFDHLTTKEHLLLYGSIKAPQWDRNQLHMEVKRTLKDTGLYSHRHKPVRTLSGGMRRKLSISIALIGGSKVVILDEPTTGVDPCSRRGIWEVISKNKTDKTIILSTHHLDEAEVLSDRIAFLEQGGLKCCGSPLFLKERFGSGYHLTLTKKFPDREDNRQCDSEMVTALIHSHIPEAKLKEDVGGELVYILPAFRAEISSAYLSLLRALDTKMSDLQIGCYGISDTTIEEVFLKLIEGVVDDDEAATHQYIPISNIDNLIVHDETSSTSYSFPDRDDQSVTKSEKLTGLTLTFKKIMAILIKRFHNSRRNWKGLISQILFPVLFVIIAMGLGSLSSSTANYPEILLSPNLYGTDQAVPFWIHNRSSEDLMSAMSSPPGIDNSCINNKAGCLNETSLGQWISTGNKTSQYGTCNCSSGLMVCDAPDSQPPHRLTYSKQMLYNVTDYNIEKYLLTTTLDFIQQRYGGWSFGIPLSTDALLNIVAPPSDNKTLSTIWYNPEGTHSLPAYLNSFNNFLLRANLPTNESEEYGIFVSTKPLSGSVSQQSKAATLVNTLLALSILAGYSITTASFVTYIVKEHHNGSKRLQHIAGVGEVCYWLTNFLYDLIIYLIPVALSIAMIAVFKLPAFYEFPNLGAVSILFILFGYATFPWMYLISGVFKNPGMAFIVYVCINLFIGINTIISSSLIYFLVQQQSSFNTSESLSATYNTLTSVFQVFPQFCFGYGLIQLSQQQVIQNQLSLYGNEETVDVFSMDILGWMFTAMAIQGTFCLLVRLFINDGIIYSIKSFVKRTCLKSYQVSVNNPDEDEDVMTERDRVESGNAEGDLLQLKSLTKIFHHVNKKMIAVNNMSLGIPPGECFGLLGVNGAGKTTTFKMLTGDLSPSFGNIQVRDNTGKLVNVLGFNTDWSSFGYCPQDDALDELMTGEEHLYYYARIHGIPEKHIKSASNRLLHKMDLTQYKDRVTGNYSGGTRRKLSTALALVGRPSILLLDEPSSGMDPKTKRHLWKIISEEVKDRCAVVLTSHSMEECEALCTRLAIMVKGKFQCIGSLQHIKSRFGSGFTVKMHLKDSSVSVETITSFMHSHFPNTYLKDQHFTMVEYHVPVSAGGVASIFDLMESNKANLNIIHFSVSQTTLDEVFINFAQSQGTPDNSSLRSQEFNQVVIT
ncbi:uncharacterized protein RCH25_004525 [Pelodytes ibericus]